MAGTRYPNVRKAHIVPVGYLKNWAINGKIARRKDGEPTSETKPVENVGWRKRAYERTRPSGTKIPDLEWSLSHIEDKAPAVLRAIDDLWPLDSYGKSVLAEFFGYQVV